MKKDLLSLPVVALMLAATSGTALADLDVNLTANILETTCDMKLDGGTGTDTKQTLIIGDGFVKGRISITTAQSGNGNKTFKLVMKGCPAGLTSLKTTIKGTPDGILATGLANEIAPADKGASFTAIEIARATAPTAPFTINSKVDGERLVWSPQEISAKAVSLVATIRETQAGAMTIGTFRTVATFEFTYE